MVCFLCRPIWLETDLFSLIYSESLLIYEFVFTYLFNFNENAVI